MEGGAHVVNRRYVISLVSDKTGEPAISALYHSAFYFYGNGLGDLNHRYSYTCILNAA